MLQPKRQKYRRPQKGRGRWKGVSHRGTELAFGSFGIKALETKWISARQIEAARVAITRYMQRQGQGDPYQYVFPAKPGRILFEIEGVSYDIAKEALRLGAQKLPTTTKFVVRRDYDKNA